MTNSFPSFVPSKAVKEYYLYTAKSPVTLGGVTLPGLFSTRYKTPFLLLFILALLMEVFGMIQLYIAGNFHYGFAVLLILLDLIFAFLGHLPVKEMLRIKNKLILEDNEIRKAQMKKRYFRYSLNQNIFFILIWTLAIFKVIGYYSFAGRLDAMVLLLSVIYLLIALIHVKVTGYTLFEIIRSITEKREFNKYIKNGTSVEPEPIRYDFFSEIPIEPTTINKKHNIIDLGGNNYRIETYGLLVDDDLIGLVNAQSSPNAKGIVAKEVLRHQFEHILPS